MLTKKERPCCPLQMTAEYKNIKVGSVPPETFALPQGVPVIDMSEMMKQMPVKP